MKTALITVVDYQKGNIQSVVRGLESAGAEVCVAKDAEGIAEADAVVLPGVGAFTDAMETMRENGQAEAIKAAVDAGAPFLGICLGLHLMFEAGEEHAEDGALTPGLGFLPGVVRRMPREDTSGRQFKVPHVGWNTVVPPVLANRSESVDAAAFPSTQSSPLCETRHGTKPTWPCSGVASGTGKVLAGFGIGSMSTHAGGSINDGAFSCGLFAGIEPGEYFYFTHSYIAPESPCTIAQTTHSVTFPSAVARGRIFGVQFHPEKSSDAGHRLLSNFAFIANEAVGAHKSDT